MYSLVMIMWPCWCTAVQISAVALAEAATVSPLSPPPPPATNTTGQHKPGVSSISDDCRGVVTPWAPHQTSSRSSTPLTLVTWHSAGCGGWGGCAGSPTWPGWRHVLARQCGPGLWSVVCCPPWSSLINRQGLGTAFRATLATDRHLVTHNTVCCLASNHSGQSNWKQWMGQKAH